MNTGLYPYHPGTNTEDNMIIGVDIAKGRDKSAVVIRDRKPISPEREYEMITRSKDNSRRTRRILRRALKSLGLGTKMHIMVYQVIKKGKPKRRGRQCINPKINIK